MQKLTIGIIDYGVSNLVSVKQSLYSMGYRARISRHPKTLNQTDLLLLPGVGAFPSAMESLYSCGLVDYIINKVHQGIPFIGICLGMQLLTDYSCEIKKTLGLSLIPGEVVPLSEIDWHIGWNNLEICNQNSIFANMGGCELYFNHSYVVTTKSEYCIGVSRINHASSPFTTAIQHNNVIGLQFHPEKSQQAGRQLLTSIIEGLSSA